MRYLLLPLVLLAAPAATSAPTFPTTFAGERCDGGTGVCSDTIWIVEEDGTIWENRVLEGSYRWDGATKTFTAYYYDFVGTSLVGTKEPGAPCVRGDWTTLIPDIYGTFWFCKA